MKIQAKAGQSFLALEGSKSGEGLAIFLSQDSTSLVRWHFEVYAKTDADTIFIGEFYTSPPNSTPIPGQKTRQVAAAVCPGAISWDVIVRPSEGSEDASNEVAQVILASSKCCTAPVGVTRVGERYAYEASDVSPSVHTVLPGQVITRIQAHGVGAGTIQIGAGALIRVANGFDVVLEPKAPIPPGTTITFTAVTYSVEFLESA